MSTRRPTLQRAVLSRRRLAISGLAATALLTAAGCAGHTAPPLFRQGSDDEDADRELLTAALAEEQRLLGRVEAARRQHRRLRRPLVGTVEVHRRHVALIADALDVGAPTVPRWTAPRTAAATLAALARSERRLGERHVEAAMTARSGTVARLLAGLSASAAQQDRSLALAAGSGAA